MKKVFNILTKSFVLSLFIIFSHGLKSQSIGATGTCTSTSTGGSWLLASTWNNTNPSTCKDFIIVTGATVTIQSNDNITFPNSLNGSVTVRGTLTVSSNASLNLGTASYLSIQSGGLIAGNNSNSSIISGATTYTGQPTFTNIVANGYLLNGALPIDLLSFDADQVGNTVVIKWATASEKNNAFMDVERSKDGIRFVAIHREKGHGTTSEPQQYEWIDRYPMPGLNYYRLKQVDEDGKYEYHKIDAVDFNGKTSDTGIRLYPTEVKDRVSIQLDTPPAAEALLYVVDMTGRILQRERIAAGTVQHDVQFTNLPAGQYMISLQSDKTVQTARFVKL